MPISALMLNLVLGTFNDKCLWRLKTLHLTAPFNIATRIVLMHDICRSFCATCLTWRFFLNCITSKKCIDKKLGLLLPIQTWNRMPLRSAWAYLPNWPAKPRRSASQWTTTLRTKDWRRVHFVFHFVYIQHPIINFKLYFLRLCR